MSTRAEEPETPMDRPALSGKVFASLVSATDVVSYRASRPIEAEGLSLPQFEVLRILRAAGSGGLLVHEVGQRMAGRAPNITRLVDKLECKNLVVRIRSDTDRRTVRLEVTGTGLEMLAALDGPVVTEVTEAVSHLSDEDLVRLREILTRIHGQGGCDEGTDCQSRLDC